MIRLLLSTARLRVSELCALMPTIDGVDIDQGMALVRGKGDKVRPYFDARTVRAVDRYVGDRRRRWGHT